MKQRIQSASSVFSRVTLRVVVSIGVLIVLLLPARSKLVAIAPVTSDQQLVKQCAGQSYKQHVKPGSLVYNDCGWTRCMRYPGPVAMEPADIERATIGPLVGSKVLVYQFCMLGRNGLQISTSLLPRAKLDPKRIHSMSIWKVRKTFAHLGELKTDPLKIIAAACRKYGITCQVSIQMSGKSKIYKQSPWFVSYPGGLLENSYLNYADTASIGFRKAQVCEILDQYDVGGIDLDFIGFQSTHAPGEYQTAVSNLTGLVRDLREMTRSAGKTLSARFDYSPTRCLNNGLEVENMLTEGLFDQISLGALGDQTPDARIDWWIARAHRTGCKVFPAIETLPHPVPHPVFGGIGIHPSNDMVKHGYGRPSPAYMRAVAANAYAGGADGVTLFNIACADGPFPKTTLTELADPEAIALADKQYVASVWGFRPRIYFDFWNSSFGMTPNQNSATHTIQVADDFATATGAGKSPRALLTLDFQGINSVSDVEVLVNGTPVKWNGYEYNHYDHGFWDDILEFDVPISALRNGSNVIQLKRRRTNKLFEGTLEVRKCVLEILYSDSKPDPSEIEIRRRLGSDDWFAPGNIK